MPATSNEEFNRQVVARYSRTNRSREDFESRCALLRRRLAEGSFFNNKGIANKVGVFTFCYDPALELQARAYFESIMRDSEAGRFPCMVKSVNLYDCLLDICVDEGILDEIPSLESEIGTKQLLKELQGIFSAEAFANELSKRTKPHGNRDVVLVTGIGEVYPHLRLHALLGNIFAEFSGTPVIAAYPGYFTKTAFSLFCRFPNENYYRAIDLKED